MSEMCLVDGCTRPVHYKAARLCQMHYFRRRRNGTLGEAESRVRRRGPTCTVPDCSKPHDSNGLCSMHVTRLRRHGDVGVVNVPVRHFGPDNHTWTGDEATYRAVHDRLTATYGDAGAYRCTCGNWAAHWAYDHADPNGRIGPDGPYSTRPSHYRPMCVSCHKLLDLSRGT